MTKKEPTVELNETGYSVIFTDLVIGIHSDQASSEPEAIKLAKEIHKEVKESQKDQLGSS